MPGARRLRDGTFIYWWIELSLILAVVLVAVLIAPMFLAPGAPPAALGNGIAIVDAERFLGMYHEETIQRWALDSSPVVITANWWYGVMHFAVTALAGIWLFRRRSDSYPLWRNTLAISSVLALATQALWPATPPRLLDGAGATGTFVDTLSHYSSVWSFHGHGSGGVANQYAAMPSMHAVWSLWVACVIVPRTSNRWIRACAIAYPAVTLLAIVITGNHYVLDAVGGYVALGIGYVIARRFTRRGRGQAQRGVAVGECSQDLAVEATP
jgi:PAP2 superfamily